MRVGPSRNTSWPIFTPDPAVKAHPLNQGRAAWFLPLPHHSGGQQFFDIAGMSHLTATGLGATSGWIRSARPGGYSAVQVADGGAGYQLIAPAALKVPFPIAIACWYRTAGTADSYSAIFSVTANNTNTSPYEAYQFISDANGKLAIGGNSLLVDSTRSMASLTVWTRLLAIFLGPGGCSIYVNGMIDATSSTALQTPSYSSTSLVAIGNHTGISRNSACQVDDATIWTGNPMVVSSPGQFAAMDYDQSRRGYPDVLNRYRPSVVTLAGKSVIFPRHLYDRSGSRGVA